MTHEPTPHETILAAAVREMEDQVNAAFGAGAFQELGCRWDAVFLRRPGTRETRDADLALLARRLARGWKIHKKDVRLKLRKIAKANDRTYREEKIDCASFGLLLAADALKKPQTVKLGRKPWISEQRRDEWSLNEEGNLIVPRKIRNHPSKPAVQRRGRWIADEHGAKMLVKPDSLPPSVKLRWFVAAAKKAALAQVQQWSLDDSEDFVVPWPHDSERNLSFADEITPPPDAALVAEEATARSLPDLLKMATPQQRDIILSLAHPDHGPLLEGAMERPLTADEHALLDTPCGSKAEAARLLGLRNENQVYVQLNRLGKRFRAQPLP